MGEGEPVRVVGGDTRLLNRSVVLEDPEQVVVPRIGPEIDAVPRTERFEGIVDLLAGLSQGEVVKGSGGGKPLVRIPLGVHNK